MKQIRSCDNCRLFFSIICKTCKNESNWKSKRGRKPGSKPKPGSKTPGPDKLPVGEKKEHLQIYVKGEAVERHGGTDKAQKAAVKYLEKKSNSNC